jgi:DNA-binding transcriptional regulator YdaS (Cro superfamily)
MSNDEDLRVPNDFGFMLQDFDANAFELLDCSSFEEKVPQSLPAPLPALSAEQLLQMLEESMWPALPQVPPQATSPRCLTRLQSRRGQRQKERFSESCFRPSLSSPSSSSSAAATDYSSSSDASDSDTDFHDDHLVPTRSPAAARRRLTPATPSSTANDSAPASPSHISSSSSSSVCGLQISKVTSKTSAAKAVAFRACCEIDEAVEAYLLHPELRQEVIVPQLMAWTISKLKNCSVALSMDDTTRADFIADIKAEYARFKRRRTRTRAAKRQ